MSGSPTQAELQAQWRLAVDILEDARNYFDGTVALSGGQLDLLEQALEGDFVPARVANALARWRANASFLVSREMAQELLSPFVNEYMKLVTADPSAYTDIQSQWRAIYEHFRRNSLSVNSRAITYDTSATLGAGNVGNGTVSRLTVDEGGFSIENCTVEEKVWRCRQDMNSGAQEHAELFEVIGRPSSYDSLLVPSFGSGDAGRVTIFAAHAGTGDGGSKLNNSSFSTFNSTAAAADRFTNWSATIGGSSTVTQDTTNYYRGSPGTTTPASMKITAGGSGTVTVKQTLSRAAVRRLDPETPYFLRIMVNKTIGAASGGSVTVRMGSKSTTSTIAGLGSNWVELAIAFTSDCWFRNFNENPFDIEIEWSTPTSGYLLVDDVIFAPWDWMDGTWWKIRATNTSNVPWKVDDTLSFTDTGGAPATGKIQYWAWIAFGLYLPSNNAGAETFTDP